MDDNVKCYISICLEVKNFMQQSKLENVLVCICVSKILCNTCEYDDFKMKNINKRLKETFLYHFHDFEALQFECF